MDGLDGALGSTAVTIVPQASHRILSPGVLVACIATLQIGHGLGDSSSDVSSTKRTPPGMRRRAGPLEVGLTPRCVLPAPQLGHLGRVFKGNCKLFRRNFSGMADLINFMAGNHKTLLQIDAWLLFMRSNKTWI